MMAKIGNLQKMMITFDIFAEEKSSLNKLKNLTDDVIILGHSVHQKYSANGDGFCVDFNNRFLVKDT